MNKRCIAAGVILATATAALAHQGVQNPAVKARMDGMSAIAKNLKTLGMMARGATAFDAEAAKGAAAAIATRAAALPGLFEANETDPMSEAKPAIWTNFEDFSAKASELESIAAGLSTSITTPAAIPGSLIVRLPMAVLSGRHGRTVSGAHD